MGKKASVVTGLALLGALAGYVWRQSRMPKGEHREVQRWEGEGGAVPDVEHVDEMPVAAGAAGVPVQDDPNVWQFPKS